MGLDELFQCVCTAIGHLSQNEVLHQSLAHTVCTESQCFETMEDLEGGVVVPTTPTGSMVFAVALALTAVLALFPPPRMMTVQKATPSSYHADPPEPPTPPTNN